MFVSEVSLWGAAIVAAIVIIAFIALSIADWKMSKRMLSVLEVTVGQMAVVALVVILVNQTNAWWAYLLWYLLVLILSICWCLYPLQSIWKKMVLPISMGMLAGSIVVAGSTLLCLPVSTFLSVYSVLMACLTASIIQTMQNYMRSLQQGQPEPGGKLLDRILPQVRSMAQPMVMVMPTLYAGMLMGGVSAFTGLIVCLLLTAATFVANVLAGVVTLLCTTREQINE